jgi:glycosyltransferase involved in cell wall biosynthesis
MIILNLIWGVSLGGVGKCFLTYARLGEVDPQLVVHSVCINLQNEDVDVSPYESAHATIINIKNRLDFSWIGKCYALINEVKPDLLFSHGFNGPVVAQILRWRYGLAMPLICTYHGAYHAPRLNRRIFEPVFNSALHYLYRHYATGILAVASCCKDYLIQYGVPSEKVKVIHNGIASTDVIVRRPLNELMPAWQYEAGIQVVAVASRLDAVKGISYLLHAMAVVRVGGCKLMLVVLGDGPELESLKSVTARLGLQDTVCFMGAQNNIPEWLEVIDIFALPSLFEYHSIGLLEAMRAGKAIVATNVGGNPESVRDGQEALLVPPADAKALANALVRLAGDANLRHRLGNAARKRFEAEFTEETMKRHLADWLLSFAPRVQSS